MRIDVVLNPPAIARLQTAQLREKTCVVFDILRATTTIVTALAHGMCRVYPVATIEEALAWKTRMPEALLGGERGGERIAGFDLGNSPLEYLEHDGRDVITTTTNGTAALQACATAREVYAAAFVNLEAMARHLRMTNAREILLVCAGTGDAFAFEDGLAAGALVDALAPENMNDAAVAMRDLYRQNRHDLAAAVRKVGNGAVLMRNGREQDVQWAFQRDIFTLVARSCGKDAGLTAIV